MGKQFRKILITGVMLIMCVVTLSACDNNVKKYHATLYDRALDYMEYDYMLEHLVKGASYYNGYKLVNPDDDNLPLYYSYAIYDNDAFKNAFKEFPQELDFSKQMICLYIFSCTMNGRDYKIESIESGENVTIAVKLIQKNLNGDAVSMPMLRCIAIVMDRIENKKIVFTKS